VVQKRINFSFSNNFNKYNPVYLLYSSSWYG